MNHLPKNRLLLVLLSLCSLGSSPPSNVPGVAVQGEPVFTGPFSPDTWKTVRFFVQTQDQGISGQIAAKWQSYNDNDTISSRSVEIPPYSQRQYFLYTQHNHRQHKLTVYLRLKDGREISSQSFSQSSHYSSAAPFLIIGERVQPGRVEAVMEEVATRPNRINLNVVSNPENLPDRFLGYTPFSAVFLAPAGYAMMGRFQWKALLDWVQMGGRLFLAPESLRNLPPPVLTQPPFAELPPASSLKEPIEKQHGLGRVFLFPSDPFGQDPPPIAGKWVEILKQGFGYRSALEDTEKALLKSSGRFNYTSSKSNLWPYTATWTELILQSFAMFSLPTPKNLLVALGLYALVCGPLLYGSIGRHPSRTKHLLWVLPVIGSFTAGLGVVWYIHLRGTQPQMQCLRVVHVPFPNKPFGFAETTLAILAPQPADLTVEATNPNTFFIPFSWAEGQEKAMPVQDTHPRVEHIPIPHGQSRLLFSRQFMPLPPVNLTLREDETAGSKILLFDNPLPSSLERSILVQDGRSFSVQFRSSERSAIAKLMPESTNSSQTPEWKDQRDRAAVAFALTQSIYTGPVLVGWRQDPSPPFRFTNVEGRISSQTLFLFPVTGE